MSLYFRPLIGLSCFSAVLCTILIGLGTWQYFRLQWKSRLLERIEMIAHAPPADSLRTVQGALDAGQPIDFRRFSGKLEALGDGEPFYVFTTHQRDTSWRVFLPVQQEGVHIFADVARISDMQKSTGAEPPALPAAGFMLHGYIRRARPVHWGQVRSSWSQNRWFGFNPVPAQYDWAESVSVPMDMRFYLERDLQARSADMLVPRQPDIANNHFGYMLTWYGLAVYWVMIYFLLHYQQGRFRFAGRR